MSVYTFVRISVCVFALVCGAGAQTKITTIDRAATFSSDVKRVAAATDDLKIEVKDVATGKVEHTLVGHKDNINAVAFSPDGKLLASGGEDFLIKLWDVATGRE